MPPRRVLPRLAVPLLLALSGCGYVHLGPLPATPDPVIMGDEKLLKENSNLRTEKKILQQELALTRAQGDALRSAIENRTADGDTSKRLTEKLNQTSRDLATLRADYAKLQQERIAAPAASPKDLADLTAKLGATEDRLASTLRNFTQLQDEVGRLRTDLDRTRTENLALTDKVKVITAKNEEAQAALAALNADLLTQKETRVRAEQDALTLRTQLDSANTKLTALAQQRTAPAAEARGLAPADAKPGEEGDVRVQLDALRKKVWSLESERNELQQQLSAIESAGKAPGLAELKARSETAAKLTAALDNAKMLRDENDHLKAGADTVAKAKAALEAELATARTAAPLAAQAGSLREQLRVVQAQAATLVEENSKLKARLAIGGGGSNAGNSDGGGAPTSLPPSSPPMSSGVTATFVTSVAGQSTTPTPTGITRTTKPGGALRFHNVTSGDTLSKISNLYYGTPTRWAEILVANRDILGEDNNLVVGRTLRIP